MSDNLMTLLLLFAIILFLSWTALRSWQYWRAVSSWVHPADLARRLEAGEDILVLDVRTAEEFEQDGHIKGAVNIPLNDLAKSLVSNRQALRQYDNTPVVVACRVGGRSTTAVTQLRKFGLKQANMMRGGVAEWARSGLPLVK